MAKLWQDKNGAFNAAKFWAMVAFAIASFAVAKMSILGTLSDFSFIAYLAIVGGADVAKKWITMAYTKEKQ
jgi:hypothetical protein